MLATWHYHIEVSSICTIKCPKCPRQELPDTLVQSQLDLKFFEENFTDEILTNTKQITFCGDDGDPIYCREFIDIVQYLKTKKPDIRLLLITNGAWKPVSWWTELSQWLNEYDTVHFSLDGWDQESNEKYRVNTDWVSIIRGIKALRVDKSFNMDWACIAISFNQDDLPRMERSASELGFNEFQITKSTKFEDNDPLAPRKEWISSSGRFERINTSIQQHQVPVLTDAVQNFRKMEVYKDVRPLCHIGTKGLYINAQGEFFPCCWIANRYQHNKTWDKNFNLHEQTLESILSDEFWNNEFLSFNHQECKQKCNSKEVTEQTVQKW